MSAPTRNAAPMPTPIGSSVKLLRPLMSVSATPKKVSTITAHALRKVTKPCGMHVPPVVLGAWSGSGRRATTVACSRHRQGLAEHEAGLRRHRHDQSEPLTRQHAGAVSFLREK